MQSRFSSRERAHAIDRMRTEEFDLVVIGGGITGAGVARDAVSRGMKVALIEARDFAEGTSSRSSKLIHGGIRYLENLEFGLVFEALSERRNLFDMAPHLVHPLRFVLPLYKGARVGMFKMGLGMWLYDALSMFEAPELHERLSADESLERLPLLRRDQLLGSFVYSDAYMDDDRLVLETLRSAAAGGALCANFVKAVGAEMAAGKVSAVECEDRRSGRKFTVRGRHFVSTVGPWTDIVATDLLKTWRRVLRPTKGVHLTFDRKRIPLSQAVVMAADKDKRIVFGIPRHEMIIIGTTDTNFSGDPADVATNPEDVKYLLNIAGEYFPGAKLTKEDIIASYAGVRPLIDDGAESESKTSREHLIYRDPRNVTFVAGGKYTTYRRMAEDTVEAVLHDFPLEDRVRFRNNDTKVALNPRVTPELLGEARLRVEEWAVEHRLSPGAVRFLVDRHGAEAEEILRLPIGPINGFSEADRVWALEAAHAAQQTMCLSLIDFCVRRSPLFLAYRDHGLALIPTISKVLARELNWDEAKRHEEMKLLQQHVQKELRWQEAFRS